MKVTVITPTYNCAAYLPGAIESVSAQTWGRVEHIVVDGGSTDGTVRLLALYPHLKWISEPDAGMYDAINKGIRLASGELLAYLNADDRYYPYTVETVVRAFAADPGLDFVYGPCTYIDERGRSLFVLRPLPYPLLRWSIRLLWPQPTCFWRRRVHDRVGFFDTAFRALGDADFFSRLLLHGLRGRLVHVPLAKFMLRQGSLMSRADDQERRLLEERYGRRRWSPARVIAEAAFVGLNISSVPRRLVYRMHLGRVQQSR